MITWVMVIYLLARQPQLDQQPDKIVRTAVATVIQGFGTAEACWRARAEIGGDHPQELADCVMVDGRSKP